MRKKMTMAAVAAMMAVSAYVGANSLTPSDQLSGLMLENIEALAEYETPDYMGLCKDHCWNRSGYICWLELNTGATVYCDEMVHWTYNP